VKWSCYDQVSTSWIRTYRYTFYSDNAVVNVNPVSPLVKRSTLGQKSGRPELDTYSPRASSQFDRYSVFLTNFPLCRSLFLLDMMKISPGIRHQSSFWTTGIRHFENILLPNSTSTWWWPLTRGVQGFHWLLHMAKCWWNFFFKFHDLIWVDFFTGFIFAIGFTDWVHCTQVPNPGVAHM
jgi:hypothetical protein